MIKNVRHLVSPDLPDEKLRSIRWALGTGAGVIFGATGGVMEAALRTAVETLTGEELPNTGFPGGPRYGRASRKPPTA